MVPATAFRRSALREAMMTSAPSRIASSAVERPIPDEPPTTTTLLPASIMTFPKVLFRSLCGDDTHAAPDGNDDQVGSNCVPIPGLLRPRPGSSQTPAPEGLISAAISTSIR